MIAATLAHASMLALPVAAVLLTWIGEVGDARLAVAVGLGGGAAAVAAVAAALSTVQVSPWVP